VSIPWQTGAQLSRSRAWTMLAYLEKSVVSAQRHPCDEFSGGTDFCGKSNDVSAFRCSGQLEITILEANLDSILQQWLNQRSKKGE